MAARLLERGPEMAAVAELLASVRRGVGGVLVIEGPAGIGKTALVDHAAASAGDLRVLRATGGERDLAFGFVRELLAPLQRAAAEDLERSLRGPAAPAGAVFRDAISGAADVAAVAFGLHWFLVAVAEDGPVAVLADDVDGADPSSRRWMEYFVRRAEGLPIAVLVSGRPGVGSGSPAALAAAAGCRVTRLQSLSRTAVGRLLARDSQSPPSADFTDACHRVTGATPGWSPRCRRSCVPPACRPIPRSTRGSSTSDRRRTASGAGSPCSGPLPSGSRRWWPSSGTGASCATQASSPSLDRPTPSRP